MKYDVSYLKIEDDGTYWVKIGMAFDIEKDRIKIKLDALPLQEYWNGSLTLFPKEEK